MPGSNLKPSDVIAAAMPATAGLTLSHVNTVLTTVSILLGIGYLIWKWRKEANNGIK